ncbi:J domain-containing protein [Pseudomonas cichorii]|nr:J domain-containing protein [Pseudomonas cichorii]
MNCWSVLGLEPDTDTRSIKRQYATLLKQYRPDEDPEGFQRLREAYEQALDWAHEPQESKVFDHVTTLDPSLFQPVNDGEISAWKRAEQLVEGITADNLVARIQQAQTDACEAEFEKSLLQLCQSDANVMREMAEPAVEHLYWQTPWQRQDFSCSATEPVSKYLLNNAERQLHDTLKTGNARRLLELCHTLEQKAWLQTLDRRRWFNECLARQLLDIQPWSNTLFETVCSRQGWKQTGNLTPCPEPYWSELLHRSHNSSFLEEQQRLAAQNDNSPAARAARLFFRPMHEDARVQFTAAFNKADWQMCEKLASTLQQRYPGLVNEIPGMNPYFWRPLQRNHSTWAMPLAIACTSAEIAFNHFFRQGSSLLETLATMLQIVGMFGLLAWGLNWCCRNLGLTAWRVDRYLLERCGKWLSLRRPEPLPIRDSLAVWLFAILVYLSGGMSALLVYTAPLLGLSLWSRTPWPARFRQKVVKLPPGSWPREIVIGVFFGLLASSLWGTAAIINYRSLDQNQGLQAWPMRFCAIVTDASSACKVPATREQWYSPIPNKEAGHDQ